MTHKPDGLRTRLIVMTDISSLTAAEGEPDDTQSLIRLLLYANDFDIEGLIATHTEHNNAVNPEFIRAIVGEYGKVRDNLLLHDPRYPTEQSLLNGVKAGHVDRDSIGPGMDTEASDWIISVVDRPDPRPVWITIWGGSRELAQALWKVGRARSPREFSKFKSKLRVYSIHNQDTTGERIRAHHPDLFYITSYQAHRGLYRDGDASLVTPEWVDAHVTKGHGPLGAAYPNYDDGDPWGAVKGIKEGDTPSFLYLVPNGLGNPEQPTWGSWGGRFAGEGPHYFDAKDTVGADTSERATVYRWRAAYQADFQARMDWCVKPYDEANHAPIVAIAGPLERVVSPGEVVELSTEGSGDPDGDRLSYEWYFYCEPSSYQGPLRITSGDKQRASFIAPEVDSPRTIHIVLTVADDGSPPLSSYCRVVISVE